MNLSNFTALNTGSCIQNGIINTKCAIDNYCNLLLQSIDNAYVYIMIGLAMQSVGYWTTKQIWKVTKLDKYQTDNTHITKLIQEIPLMVKGIGDVVAFVAFIYLLYMRFGI